jgi:hypothetical protein
MFLRQGESQIRPSLTLARSRRIKPIRFIFPPASTFQHMVRPFPDLSNLVFSPNLQIPTNVVSVSCSSPQLPWTTTIRTILPR